MCYNENLDATQKQKQFWNYIKSTIKDNTAVSTITKDGILKWQGS
jgi:hypothetical protein